jgi:hypothetical protein
MSFVPASPAKATASSQRQDDEGDPHWQEQASAELHFVCPTRRVPLSGSAAGG